MMMPKIALLALNLLASSTCHFKKDDVSADQRISYNGLSFGCRGTMGKERLLKDFNAFKRVITWIQLKVYVWVHSLILQQQM